MKPTKKTRFIDLKLPLGCLLAFYGIVLSVYGLVTDKVMYQKSLGIDVNLVWGLIILFLGIFMIVLCLRKRSQTE